MEAVQEEKDHRRFLKQNIEHYKLGAFFPESLVLLAKTDPVCFEWLRRTEHGTIVFFMSATCTACNMKPAISFMDLYPDFDYCLLFEGSPEAYEEQRSQLAPEVAMHRCETTKLQARLKVNVVPYVIVLNKIGQAIGADIFHDLAKLQKVASPLIRVYQNGKAQT